MKIARLIARILLGLVFLIFGLNGFLHFIPAPPPPGLAGQYLGILVQSHYVIPVFLFQLLGGVLLLINRFVPLALVILGPILVNILLFHFFIYSTGLSLALVVTLLWFIVFSGVRQVFTGIFAQKVEG